MNESLFSRIPRTAPRAIQTCLLVWVLGSVPAFAQETEARVDLQDPVERTMAFVDQSFTATTLFNEGKYEQALTIFQRLLQAYPDLDEDGYVVMATSDALLALNRSDEARKVLQEAWERHPQLENQILYRLREIDLQTEVTEALIAELRKAAATPGEGRAAAAWQLARALQLRAVDLLRESAGLFREVVAQGNTPRSRLISNQAAMLEELREDLDSLVSQMEDGWASYRQLSDLVVNCNELRRQASQTSRYQASWMIVSPDIGQVAVQAEQTDEQFKIMIDQQTVRLNETQSQLIRRHQERINAILLEAAAETREQP